MQSYKLHLIRHGLTEGNLKGLYIGSGTDSPLCETGIERLEYLKDAFAYPYPEKLYVSPMTRCRQTAEIIYPGIEQNVVDKMKECNFGVFDGKSFQELMRAHPEFLTWLSPESKFKPEGGESSREFRERVVLGINEIFTDMMTKGIHEAACVTHGGVIILLMSLLAYPRKAPDQWSADNGCGFTIQTDTRMWTRDNAFEAVQILPVGYDSSEKQFNRFTKEATEGLK